MFEKRQIDGAFVSSIKSKGKKCADIGIISHDEVLSVLCVKGVFREDIESNSSNILAQILKISGQVVIGDKALKLYFDKKVQSFVDMGKIWNEKQNLPFVYARLCFNKNDKLYNKLAKKFLNTNIKIPSYILNKQAKKVGITTKQLKIYLSKISYKIGHKEQKSLKLFFKLSKAYN